MSLKIDFEFPTERPDQSPEAMRDLQEKLDILAQKLFGARNPAKQLLFPKFVADGPHVRNTYNLDGGYAELSLNAAGYWPTAIYELAHETIHLLDPRPGFPIGQGASWLEEGLAVNFSISVARANGDKFAKVNSKKYQIANGLFSRIGGNLFSRAKQIRDKSGHFSDAKIQDILSIAPQIPEHVAKKLVSSFYS